MFYMKQYFHLHLFSCWLPTVCILTSLLYWNCSSGRPLLVFKFKTPSQHLFIQWAFTRHLQCDGHYLGPRNTKINEKSSCPKRAHITIQWGIRYIFKTIKYNTSWYNDICLNGYRAIDEEMPNYLKVSQRRCYLLVLSFQMSGIAHVLEEENKWPSHLTRIRNGTEMWTISLLYKLYCIYFFGIYNITLSWLILLYQL